MKYFKSVAILAISALMITSCKSVSSIPVPLGADTVINLPAKKSPLTTEQKQTWSHADLATDTIPGMSVKQAYQFVQGKSSKQVIVAVVDSGMDIEHEDLAGVIWTNPKEIANNGKDDDKNGYIDDVHGWNFLGPIYKAHLEADRILQNPKLVDAATYQKVKAANDKKIAAAKSTTPRYKQMLQAVTFADNTLAKFLNKKDYTKEEVAAIKTDDASVKQSAAVANQMYGFGLPSLTEAITELTKLVADNTDLIEGNSLKKDYRAALGDNPYDIKQTVYGNNDPSNTIDGEAHATHVAGIIGGVRNNGIGINGVANNVKIMSVRVVPDGDERDKDVALGIRYAVDNGAKVINGSFGKAFSPHKQWVYDAIKYAAKHDVLIVIAAGNDNNNIDEVKTYPNDSDYLPKEIADNVLTIGAMSASYNQNLPATFSNYGKMNVDIFAPGVQIYSSVPHNKYQYFNGTSMAAPATAGVAALIREYYPSLSASQVKHIIMNSGTKINLNVIRPGSVSQKNPKGIMVPFSELSVSGRVVNAYNALKMADRMVNGK